MTVFMTRACVCGVIAMASASLFAQDCKVRINEANPGGDVERILRCFDERIKFLESQVDASNGSQLGRLSANSEFDAGSFAVSVTTAKREGRQISILLSFRNKTSAAVYIGRTSQRVDNAVLFDEKTGLSDEGVERSGVRATYAGGSKDSYSAIPAYSRINAAYTFDGSKIQGGVARLTMVLLEYAEPRPKQVTVSLNVRIQN